MALVHEGQSKAASVAGMWGERWQAKVGKYRGLCRPSEGLDLISSTFFRFLLIPTVSTIPPTQGMWRSWTTLKLFAAAFVHLRVWTCVRLKWILQVTFQARGFLLSMDYLRLNR